jgi:hypothetical protein
MGFPGQQRVRFGSRLWGAVMCVGLCCAAKPAVSPWDAAVEARARFEAEPAGTHTKAEYGKVMDEFRAIYHADPGAAHAARAVEQVAELLAEQGREFHDSKSLRDAAGQYEFLAKSYPSGSMAPKAMEQAIILSKSARFASSLSWSIHGTRRCWRRSRAGVPLQKRRYLHCVRMKSRTPVEMTSP